MTQPPETDLLAGYLAPSYDPADIPGLYGLLKVRAVLDAFATLLSGGRIIAAGTPEQVAANLGQPHGAVSARGAGTALTRRFHNRNVQEYTTSRPYRAC